MIITVGGRAGAGKSTISRLLAKKLDLTHYSTGDLMRMMAIERGISLLELSKIAEKDKSIDKELDQRQIELGKKHDNFVIDGRLAAFFIPNSIKIFLDADKKERAKRIIRDKRKEETSDSVAGMIKELHVRELSEKRRYHKYYDFDCYNIKYYEIVVNTTHTTKEETVSKVINKMKLFVSKPKR